MRFFVFDSRTFYFNHTINQTMIQEFYKSTILFFKSSNLQKGVILAISIVVPVSILITIGRPELSFSVGIGALLNAPSDIPGSLKRKVNSILVSILLTSVITFLIILVKPYFFILLIAICLLAFLISLIAVFGFRGALISFSGLLAIVLGLINKDYNIEQALFHVALIAVGGLWYLSVSLFFHWLMPKKDEDELLKDTLKLTAHFFQIRAKLLNSNSARQELQIEGLKIQSEINEKHETLRESLLSARRRSGRSHYDEKRLLIFISLIDILELALAHTWNYDQLDELFKKQPECLASFQNMNNTIADHLYELADIMINKTKLPHKYTLLNALNQSYDVVDRVLKVSKTTEDQQDAILLKNLFDYQEKQVYEVRAIRRVLANVKNASKLALKRKDADQFITHQEYRFNIILENFSLKSPVFRHALRITTSILCAYVLGTLIGIKNPYWIVLTLIVIMRPNYGLTKERTFNRVIGTVVGAIIASSIIYLTQSVVLYASLAVISLVFAFALVQQSYKIAAAFITLNVIFVYALLEPNTFDIIKYRVLDTFIGASIAIAASYVLWPSWESLNLKEFLKEAMKKNSEYLEAVKELYHDKTLEATAYKIPRKEAFLAIANLNSAFQRLTQDPKSKQKEYELIYEMVTLNNTILSALASLSSFIQNHDIGEVSDHFDTMVNYIENILDDAIHILDNDIRDSANTKAQKAEEKLYTTFQDMIHQIDTTQKIVKLEMQDENMIQLQEVHLLYNQLVWLTNLSEDLKKSCHKYLAAF